MGWVVGHNPLREPGGNGAVRIVWVLGTDHRSRTKRITSTSMRRRCTMESVVPWRTASGGQGRRFHYAVLLVRDDQGRVLFRLAPWRARAALGLRGVIRRQRAGRRGWFDGGRTRASLQPCHRIPQILVFNPQDGVLSRQRLDDVQQLDHDLAGCQIGNAIGVEVRYLHILVVY